MKKQTNWNILRLSQQAIETEYLQFYPLRNPRTRELITLEKGEEHLKNGQITRDIHGGMHVGRASLLVLVLNYLFQQCFPEYAHESTEILSKALGISPELLIDLTRAAVIYHDSARENEGVDCWDKESAKKLYTALTLIGQSQFISELFQSAAANKNSPKAFREFCAINLPTVNSEQADYLRVLINLADCFDIIRCVGKFEFVYVMGVLESIPGYNRDTHLPVFISLAQNLHTVIWDQGDMLYDCQLMLEGQVIPTERQGSHFIRARKVQFEHAPNVVSALAAHMMTYPYFKPMLEGKNWSCTDLATVKPAFDPYIHGTQSGFLTVLKVMRDRGLPAHLDSPLALAKQMLAPMTGELSRRGANCKLMDSSRMCFGRLKLMTTESNQYNYKKTEFYATSDAKKKDDIVLMREIAKREFQFYQKQCFGSGFTYINAFMTYYLRAKQLGIPDQELMSPEEKEHFIKSYKRMIDVYYLILLLEKHLRIDSALMDKLGWSQVYLARKVGDLFTLTEVLNRLAKAGIDVKAIYQNPTQENLAPLVDLFTVPGYEPWLVVRFDAPQPCEIRSDTHYDFIKLTQNDFGIELMLLHYIEHYPSPRSVVGMQRHIPQHIQLMEECLVLLEQVLNSASPNLLDDPSCHSLLTQNFPVMIVCEAEEAIELALFQDQEFRAKRPLIFGQDVTTLATDTREHALILRKFLDQNGFSHVGVTLFSELEQLRSYTTRPTFIHTDEKSRVPTLAWMAAKAVVPGVVQSRKGPSLHDILEKKLHEAQAKYREAQAKPDNIAECEAAKAELNYAYARFNRVRRWLETLEDATTYNEAFNNDSEKESEKLGPN